MTSAGLKPMIENKIVTVKNITGNKYFLYEFKIYPRVMQLPLRH